MSGGRKPAPMLGLTFGVLSVAREAAQSTPKNKIFVVVCGRCGTERTMHGGNIRRAVRSGSGGCRCVPAATAGHFAYRHGLSGHPLYRVWSGMLSRCERPSHPAYARYGGRGISVCAEWREDVGAFIGWAEGRGWVQGMEVDRTNNDLGYSPENCRIVSALINANNRSNNRRLHIAGQVLTVAEAARKFGLGKTTIKERLNRGWSDEDAVRAVA